MKLDDLDRELTRIKEASERVAANLVELEIDSSRRLLEASTLTGESAEQWSAASVALTQLWEWRGLLEGFLERAQELKRSPRRADELHALLTGPAIELSRSEVPLAERDLLSSPEVSVRCNADELLARMSRAFDEVKTVVARFGAAWETVTPRLAEARAALDRAQATAAPLGEAQRTDLEEAARRIGELTTRLGSDPLTVALDEPARLLDSLHAIERDLDATAALRRDFDARLGDARTRLGRLETLLGEARAAHEELLVKISAASAPAPPGAGEQDGLRGELDRIATLAASGAWREARRRLDAWTDRVVAAVGELEGVVRANRAPLEARNQLRALLEAYQVKAAPPRRDRGLRARADLRPGPRGAVHGPDRPGRRSPARAPLPGDGERGPGGAQMNCPQPGCTGSDRGRLLRRVRMAPPHAAPTPLSAPAPLSGPTPAPASALHAPPSSALTAASSGTSRRATTGRTRTSARGRLGAGLVEIPEVPYRDPADAVLDQDAAVVPESRRFCARCDEPVGRARDGAPGRTAGFCRKCGAPFSFEPKLGAGELVAGQYEVVGCLAHGGMGWIYLARDRNVSDRWVVLKGLLNSGDDDAMAAAAGRAALPGRGRAPEHREDLQLRPARELGLHRHGVRGRAGASSRSWPRGARPTAGEPDPLPAAQAIAYMLEILPALGYLHQLGLLFCDFKIDNVIQTQHSLKLIDLGGVYRMEDPSCGGVRHGRLPGARDRRRRPVDRLRSVHGGAHPGRAVLRLPRLPEHLSLHAAAPGLGAAAGRATTRCTASC